MWWTISAVALLAANAGFVFGRMRRREERDAMFRLAMSVSRLADAIGADLDVDEDGTPGESRVIMAVARGLH